MPRETVVRTLVDQISSALTDACDADPSTTADEVFSAVLTQARNIVAVARKGGADPARLRQAVDTILIECFDPRRVS